VLLSACLGAPVVRGGRRIGELDDLGAAPAGPAPVLTGIVVHRRGNPPAWVAWREVEELLVDRVVLASGGNLEAVPASVLLARDVLDAQIIDLAGRRVVRVGDVRLHVPKGSAGIQSVEAGLDSVLRRLGLERLARRAPRHVIAWTDLHLPAHPGAALTLDAAAPALAQLSDAERARLAARLPAHAAAALRPPRHLVPHRFPTHVLRRRRAPR
jgi:magnesium transporter